MLRALGITSSLMTVLWLFIIRFVTLSSHYANSPVGQIISLTMMIVYLGIAGVIALGVRPLLRASAVTMVAVLAGTVLWSLFDAGLHWSIIALWVLQISTIMLVFALYRRASTGKGPSIFDLPVYG